jgi:hypothetical protein
MKEYETYDLYAEELLKQAEIPKVYPVPHGNGHALPKLEAPVPKEDVDDIAEQLNDAPGG